MSTRDVMSGVSIRVLRGLLGVAVLAACLAAPALSQGATNQNYFSNYATEDVPKATSAFYDRDYSKSNHPYGCCASAWMHTAAYIRTDGSWGGSIDGWDYWVQRLTGWGNAKAVCVNTNATQWSNCHTTVPW